MIIGNGAREKLSFLADGLGLFNGKNWGSLNLSPIEAAAILRLIEAAEFSGETASARDFGPKCVSHGTLTCLSVRAEGVIGGHVPMVIPRDDAKIILDALAAMKEEGK